MSFLRAINMVSFNNFDSLHPPQTLQPLPCRQKVAEIPDINWRGYMESVEKIVQRHSSVYMRTRRKAGKEVASLTKMVCTVSHWK